MDQKEKQPNNKIIFCSRVLHRMYKKQKHKTRRTSSSIPPEVTTAEIKKIKVLQRKKWYIVKTTPNKG